MEQLTLNLQEIKQEIREEMAKTAQSFVVIGYRLRQILDSGAYIQDGYSDFNDFALKEFGLSQSGTSRFISINKKYSVDGYGPMLREEYSGFSCSQLTEMLSLSESDRALVSEDMTVTQIREVKSFIRDEDKSGQQSFVSMATPEERELYLHLFENCPDMLQYILEQNIDGKELCEQINPSDMRVFKYKTVMLFMYEYDRGILIRQFGNQTPVAQTYDDLLDSIRSHVDVGDVEQLRVNATSHIEENVKSTESEKESKEEKHAAVEKASKEKPEKEERTKDEEKDIALDSADHHVGDSESEQETGETGQEDQDDRNEDVPVEKVEGEVVDSEPVLHMSAPVQQAIDANTMRGYKSAMRSQIRQLGVCLEDENWERMKRIAKDIVWRANKIITMEDGE